MSWYCWAEAMARSSRRHYGAGPSPQSVAVGDFNGDGNPDLAVANLMSANWGGSTSITVLLARAMEPSESPPITRGMGRIFRGRSRL